MQEFRSLLREGGLPDDSADHPSRLTLSLSQAMWDRFIVASAMSQSKGEYSFEVPSGSYFVCLGNLSRGQAGEITPGISGCLEVEVPDAADLKIDLLWGEAGLTAR